MSSLGHYLLTANILINYIIGRRNPARVYPYFVTRLFDWCREESVSLYMTDFDLSISLLLIRVCLYYQTSSEPSPLDELARYVRVIEINDNILETASILTLHPTDAVRLGAAVEHGLDGIITWDAEHFLSQPNEADVLVSGGTRIRYKDILEKTDPDSSSDLEINVFSVNEFFINFGQPEDLVEQSEELQAVPLVARNRDHSRFSLSSLRYGGTVSLWEGNRTSVDVEIQLDDGRYIEGKADGDEGLIHTTIKAIGNAINKDLTSLPPFETTISVPPLPRTEGMGEVMIELRLGSYRYGGKIFRNDLLLAVATAYLEAVNHYCEEMSAVST
jgi:hypothetical protein